MPLTMCFLDGRVVGVFVRDEVSGLDVATIGIFAFSIEDFFVEFDVVVVDGVVESDSDHLRNVSGGQVAGDDGAILGAETVRQHALRRVARRSSVRIVVNV